MPLRLYSVKFDTWGYEPHLTHSLWITLLYVENSIFPLIWPTLCKSDMFKETFTVRAFEQRKWRCSGCSNPVNSRKKKIHLVELRHVLVTFKTSLVGILLSHEYFPSWSQTRSA